MITGREVVIGRVLAPHGTGGLLKVHPYSDFLERVHLLEEVELENNSPGKLYKVEKAAVHGKIWLIKFQGVDCREDAGDLRGCLLKIYREERITLPAWSFYHDQLVGLKVYSLAGILFGVIKEVKTGGSQDRLIVSPPGEQGSDMIVPAVRQFVAEINLADGYITVDLPEGMLDLQER